MAKLITFRTYLRINEAQVDKEILEKAGIPAFIFDEYFSSIAPYNLYGAGGVRLVILENHIKNVIKLLDKNSN
ncbi:MAG: hypothetical protein AAF959_23620 [Cyanobacteria bacterium P01_D01_bin.56]